MPMEGHLHVLEVGSRNSSAEDRTHRELMKGRDVAYLGIDLLPGHNVDLVMKKPYTFPIPSRSVDVLIAGSVFEHIPFVWATMLEVARVLGPGGQAFVTAPSRGHEHKVHDCWRHYPDGYRALAASSELELRDVFTDFPPRRKDKPHHHDYGGDQRRAVLLGRQRRGLPEAGYGLSRAEGRCAARCRADVGQRTTRPRRGAPARRGSGPRPDPRRVGPPRPSLQSRKITGSAPDVAASLPITHPARQAAGVLVGDAARPAQNGGVLARRCLGDGSRSRGSAY